MRARAQEHGKAFPVVANEIQKLSSTTKDAAEEISSLAASSLDISKRAGEMLGTLLPNIHQTAHLVQEITAASSEQGIGVEQINRIIQQLDQVAQHCATTIEELAVASEELMVRTAEDESIPDVPDSEFEKF